MKSWKHPTIENIKKYNAFKNTNLAKQRKAQRNYYNEKFQMNESHQRKSWQIIKKIIGKEDNSYNIHRK